jgi:hypothetical protein
MNEYLNKHLDEVRKQKEQVKVIFNKLCGKEELLLELMSEQNNKECGDGISQGN